MLNVCSRPPQEMSPAGQVEREREREVNHLHIRWSLSSLTFVRRESTRSPLSRLAVLRELVTLPWRKLLWTFIPLLSLLLVGCLLGLMIIWGMSNIGLNLIWYWYGIWTIGVSLNMEIWYYYFKLSLIWYMR